MTEQPVRERVVIAHHYGSITIFARKMCFDEVDSLIVKFYKPNFICFYSVPDGKTQPVIGVGKEIFILIVVVNGEISGEGGSLHLV